MCPGSGSAWSAWEERRELVWVRHLGAEPDLSACWGNRVCPSCSPSDVVSPVTRRLRLQTRHVRSALYLLSLECEQTALDHLVFEA